MPIDKYMRLGTAYKNVKTFQWYTYYHTGLHFYMLYYNFMH